LHEDIDFRTKVTRGDFEDITSDLVDRVPLPIEEALNDANITMEQIESVILHGGSVRVPFVQKALEDLVGANKLAKTVNQDEAAVMGILLA
jgi:hypoxia up-regulated 1